MNKINKVIAVLLLCGASYIMTQLMMQLCSNTLMIIPIVIISFIIGWLYRPICQWIDKQNIND
jgi:hypothetical protein